MFPKFSSSIANMNSLDWFLDTYTLSIFLILKGDLGSLQFTILDSFLSGLLLAPPPC